VIAEEDEKQEDEQINIKHQIQYFDENDNADKGSCKIKKKVTLLDVDEGNDNLVITDPDHLQTQPDQQLSDTQPPKTVQFTH